MQDLESFYDVYVDKVYKYFYINCLNRHVTEDLTSQTFIAYIEKQHKIGEQKQKQYLYAIMRNVWADYLRQKYKESIASLEEIEDFESYADQVVSRYEAKSLQERAAEFIQRLPEKQRQVAHLRFIDKLSPSEIAAELNTSTLYVKTTQHRALKALRTMIERAEIGGAL